MTSDLSFLDALEAAPVSIARALDEIQRIIKTAQDIARDEIPGGRKAIPATGTELALDHVRDQIAEIRTLLAPAQSLRPQIEAAIEAERERCAKECERVRDDPVFDRNDDFDRGYRGAARACLAAIRSSHLEKQP